VSIKRVKKQKQNFSASHTEKGWIFSTDKAREGTWKRKKKNFPQYGYCFPV